MPADPYQTLGIEKNATQDEIQKAYRRLAKKFHPDLNPGDKSAEENFKDLSVANDLLSDPDKRARFDRGEIDAAGAERPRRRYYRDYAGESGAHAYSNDSGFADLADDDDFLSEIFGRSGGRANVRMRGADARYRLDVDFLDAINGARPTITLPDGATLHVTIPPGTRDGQTLRLREKGGPGIGGGPPGDALIEIGVRPHPLFVRDGDDIRLELSISLNIAVLGGKVTAPTPTGSVAMRVPTWTNSGKVLRLKGKGVPRPDGSHGDEYVTLKLVLPDKPDSELEKFIAQWQPSEAERGQETEA